jgi:hypothetical protein
MKMELVNGPFFGAIQGFSGDVCSWRVVNNLSLTADCALSWSTEPGCSSGGLFAPGPKRGNTSGKLEKDWASSAWVSTLEVLLWSDSTGSLVEFPRKEVSNSPTMASSFSRYTLLKYGQLMTPSIPD